jgi:hypothetical protein
MPRKTALDDVLMYVMKTRKNYWVRNNTHKGIIDTLNLKYYLDIKPRIYEGHFNEYDQNGIPVRNYGTAIGVQYNPVNVCAYALGNLDIYTETEQRSYVEIFFKMAQWLIENQVIQNNIGVWFYNFDWGNIKKPWISGMAQGEALSVLARAYDLTKDEKYLSCAEKCMNSFKNDIANGGVTGLIDGKYKIFEEYVSLKKQTHVLNGFMYALWGIYDYYLITRNQNDKAIFDEGILSLENCLSSYDLGYWSKYDLNEKINIASYMYHSLHVIQLSVLYEMSGSLIIKHYSDLWSEYQKSYINCIKALIKKIIGKVNE